MTFSLVECSLQNCTVKHNQQRAEITHRGITSFRASQWVCWSTGSLSVGWMHHSSVEFFVYSFFFPFIYLFFLHTKGQAFSCPFLSLSSFTKIYIGWRGFQVLESCVEWADMQLIAQNDAEDLNRKLNFMRLAKHCTAFGCKQEASVTYGSLVWKQLLLSASPFP